MFYYWFIKTTLVNAEETNMTTSNKAVYLVANITILVGEVSYPMKRVTANLDGNIDTALNDLNEELKSEFLGDDAGADEDFEYANDSDREDMQEWQKGFWHLGMHTINISSYKEISKLKYDVMKSI